ncbi:MAG: B12-binding domain-containing radical SAM protein [Acidimicrobiales bacterium]|nr:B12-binding domain-containing radical SAM protein [Acidimicrobiales bacterium]
MPEAGFVVRDGGRWWSAPVPGSSPAPWDLEGLLAAVGGAQDRPIAAARGVSSSPLGDLEVLLPVWAWVGRIVPGGVELEGAGGGRLLLTGEDLVVLDVLDPGGTAEEVVGRAQRAGVADAGSRLASLTHEGLVRRLPEGTDVPVPSAPAVAAAAADPGPFHDGSSGPSFAAPAPRPGAASDPGATDGRVPVHAVWQERVGPVLALGMLTAAARAWDGGALAGRYLIGRPETAEACLASLADGTGPAVLLCSNYVWSLEDNLDLARRAKALRPELVVIHGGPSTPSYDGDARAFLSAHGDVAHVLVRGEGEVTLCRLLEALTTSLPALDGDRLRSIPGLIFRDPVDGAVVRTAEPERVADLDALPSPYLTGEFDHIDPSAWLFAVSIETNRGCPYGCSFCDWGSATLSRLRKFGVDRVLAELRWVADRGIAGVQLCDANFGILARDVDIAAGLADISRGRGAPRIVAFTPPKNTTRHITKIFDAVLDAGLLVSTAISLQTIDEATLDAVDRSNISTDLYLALAADLRRRGLPLTGDLLIGLPGQTYDSYRADLQFFLDHQISPRSWSLRALPNAPLNDPGYRARFGIETGADRIITATSTMSHEDRRRMLTLRKMQVIADQYGVLIHVLRFLQWDHGVAATAVLDHLLDVVAGSPDRFPLLSWVFAYFDLHATVPVGWGAFYDEVGRLLEEDFGLDPGASDVATVLAVQRALMPAPQRNFPDTVTLAHDYVAYHRDATAGLFATGHASGPDRPLRSHPQAELTVTGDPLHLCSGGLRFAGDSRDEAMLGQFWLGVGSSHELLSPLTRVAPATRDLELAAAGDRAAAGTPVRVRATIG